MTIRAMREKGMTPEEVVEQALRWGARHSSGAIVIHEYDGATGVARPSNED